MSTIMMEPWTTMPSRIMGIRPVYFMIVPKMMEQMALTTPKQIITYPI